MHNLDLRPVLVAQILGPLAAANLNTKTHGEEKLIEYAIQLTDAMLAKLNKEKK